MSRRADGKGNSWNTKNLLSVMAEGVGEIIRDTGHVQFCRQCRSAELPGTLACRHCGGVLVDVRGLQAPKQDALEDRHGHDTGKPSTEPIEPPRTEVQRVNADAQDKAEPEARARCAGE